MSKNILTLVFAGLLFSCNANVEPNYVVNEKVNLDLNEEYSYVLSLGIPIEGGFTIEQQAKNYELSEIIIVTNDSSWLQYNYTPKLNFTGTDVVVIENCISAGGRECNNIELFKFTFKIK